MKTFAAFVGCVLVAFVTLSAATTVAHGSVSPVPAPTPASASQSPAAGPEVLEGRLAIVWGDPQPGKVASPQTLFFLTSDQGRTYALQFGEPMPLSMETLISLGGERVSIVGSVDATAGAGEDIKTLRVRSIQASGSIAREGLTGPQPWVSILCKFPDVSGEPKPPGYFQEMYSAAYPGLDHYFTQISYDTITLQGSTTTSLWYTLPQPWSYYVYDQDGDGDVELDHGRAALDCTAVADAEIYYPSFKGINLMFNGDLDGYAYGSGGWWILTLDGVTRAYSVTWEPPWAYSNATAMSHEMGHGVGWPHSSGNYGQVYDNQWDVVSDMWSNCERATDPVYGCVGQDTIAYHLNLTGWIPQDQKAQIDPESSTTLTLEQLDSPQTNGILLARVPIEGSTSHFYTVEARRRVGYDYKLPGEGVIIHEVDTFRDRPARVIDVDGNGNTGDAGAIWSVGETFIDASASITVAVTQSTATGWGVTIANSLTINQILVDSTAQSPGASADCTLGEAIQAANTNVAVDGCTAGHGLDRIILPAGTYTLVAVDNNVDGSNGLPDITSGIILEGAGAETTLIRRAVGAPAFRIFHISPSGRLSASDIAISGGDGGSAGGGGFYNAGTLNLNDGRVAGNTASSGGGFYLASSSMTSLVNAEIVDNSAVSEGGGGFSNHGGTLDVSDSQIVGNTASWGAGVSTFNGTTTISASSFIDNIGGSLYALGGTLSVTQTAVIGTTNRGVLCVNCRLTIDDSGFYENSNSSGGGSAIYISSDQSNRISGSCIEGNDATSVYNAASLATLDATGNWWGASDGPSGAGSGSGDSVSTNVNFVPFLTERPASCPEPPVPVSILVNSTTQSPGSSGDCTLGEAIQAANTNAAVDGCTAGRAIDRIILPAGTYTLAAVNNSVDGSNGLPDITSRIILEGAGAETTLIRREMSAPAFRIFHISSDGRLSASSIAISGGDSGSAGGGGFYSAGTLNLNDSRVAGNTASSGGGFYLASSSMTSLVNAEIADNSAVSEGGGIFNQGSATLTDCLVSANSSSGNAAGIQNSFGQLNLASTTVTGNVTQHDGGGLLDLAGMTTVTASRFIANSRSGLYSNSGTLAISETEIRDNTGGGVTCWYCTVTVDGSTLYDNTGGSAVFIYSSQANRLNNSCISGNSDTAVYNQNSPAVLDATNNWWGASDGPSGAGTGSGDSVSLNVTFQPFLTERPAHCPNSAVPYDFDHDGTVDIDDIVLIALAWGSTDPSMLAVYDINHNGVVDIPDIQTVTAAWQNS